MFTLLCQRIRNEFFPESDAFDAAHGTKTVRTVWRRRMGFKTDNTGYMAISPELFSRAVNYVPRCTFVDLGCGRGRALILAVEAGFQRVIGVELDKNLVLSARLNVARAKVEAEVLHGNVLDYQLPDEHLVVFMNNPFGAATMRAVLENINRHRHSIHVVYTIPRERGLFQAFPSLYSDESVLVCRAT